MAVNGNIIKQLRKEAGLTQGELGKKLGVVKQTISSWENNVSEPNSETLSELSKLFGVSVAQLYDHGVPNIDYANFKMDTPEFVLDFKMRIRDLMEEQKMSEDEFAQRVGFHKEEKDAYLYGNKMPSIEDLIKIAGALNVSTDYLLNISSRKRISSQEESLLQKFNRCDEDSQQYLLAKAGVLCVEGISAVAAGEYGKYADEEKIISFEWYRRKRGLKKITERLEEYYGMDCSLDRLCYLPPVWMAWGS